MRTAGELYDGETKAAEPKDAPVSDSQSETKPEPVTEAKPAGEKPAVAAKPTDEVAFEDDAEAKPADVSGYEKALNAARGDKRKAKKLWQEAKARIAEEVAKARAEGEAEAYKRAMAQFATAPQAQQAAPQAPVIPDLNDQNFFDPNAVKAFVEHQVKTGVSSVQQQWFERNRAAARERHADFAEVEAEFLAAVKTNPQLGKQADESHDPAEYAYRVGMQMRELKGIGTLDEFKAKVIAEYEAQKAAQVPQLTPQLTPQTVKPPPPKSLASVRGTGVGVKPEWTPHTAEQLYDS